MKYASFQTRAQEGQHKTRERFILDFGVDATKPQRGCLSDLGTYCAEDSGYLRVLVVAVAVSDHTGKVALRDSKTKVGGSGDTSFIVGSRRRCYHLWFLSRVLDRPAEVMVVTSQQC